MFREEKGGSDKTPVTKNAGTRTAKNASNVVLFVKNHFFKLKKTSLNLNLKENASYAFNIHGSRDSSRGIFLFWLNFFKVPICRLK